MNPPVDLPAAVRRRALAYGEVGAAWLRDLPGTIGALEQRWNVTVGATLGGGTAAYVAEATTAVGAAAATNVGRDETKQQAPETKRHKGAKWIERSPA